ncbi:MAG TPA: hypothetical protein VEY95_10680 [Azospirillaceae bacterium]|nr:hypothetical protein [Azospirillaceae bacterium]
MSSPSIGVTQTDLFWNPKETRELVVAMQAAGYLKPDGAETDRVVEILRGRGDPSVLIRENLGLKINHFLNTSDGRAMVDRWDNNNRLKAVERVREHAIGSNRLEGRGVFDPRHNDHAKAMMLLGAVANNQPGGDYNGSHAFQAVREMGQPTLHDIVQTLWKVPKFRDVSGRNILTKLGIPIPKEVNAMGADAPKTAAPAQPRIQETTRQGLSMPPAGAQTRSEPPAPLPGGPTRGPADLMPPLLTPPGGQTIPGPRGTPSPTGTPAGSAPSVAPTPPPSFPSGGQEAFLYEEPAGNLLPATYSPRPELGAEGLGAGDWPASVNPDWSLTHPPMPLPPVAPLPGRFNLASAEAGTGGGGWPAGRSPGWPLTGQPLIPAAHASGPGLGFGAAGAGFRPTGLDRLFPRLPMPPVPDAPGRRPWGLLDVVAPGLLEPPEEPVGLLGSFGALKPRPEGGLLAGFLDLDRNGTT